MYSIIPGLDWELCQDVPHGVEGVPQIRDLGAGSCRCVVVVAAENGLLVAVVVSCVDVSQGELDNGEDLLR